MPTITEIAPDPMEAFKTTASVMAYIHQVAGPEGLNELLAMIEIDQERLEQDAEELRAIGLETVAAIVAAFAADALPERVLHCPYAESDTANFQSWQSAYDNRQQKPKG